MNSFPYLPTSNLNRPWFLFIGITLLILGFVAISIATMTTLISVIFIGALLFISGLIMMVDAFKFWRPLWSGFFLHFFMSILYLGVGAILMAHPVSGSISLTLLLGIFYFLIGIFRIVQALTRPRPKRGLSFFNGIISLLLGLLILASWPTSSLFIIGLFVGIDLLICGWLYIALSLTQQ